MDVIKFDKEFPETTMGFPVNSLFHYFSKVLFGNGLVFIVIVSTPT